MSKTRTYYYAESLGQSATTTVGQVTKTSLTFSPEAGARYLVIASAMLQGAAGSGSITMRLYSSQGALLLRMQACDFSSRYPEEWLMFPYQCATPAPTTETWTISWGCDQGSTTARIKLARLIVLKLNSSDHYSFASNAATTSTAWVTTHSLAFTPVSTGNYLCFGQGFIAPPGSGVGRASLAFGSHSFSSIYASNPLGQIRTFQMTRIQMGVSEQTCTLKQQNSVASRSTVIYYPCFVALRLSEFEEELWESADTLTSTSETTYQHRLTLDETFAESDWLLLCHAERICTTTMGGDHNMNTAVYFGDTINSPSLFRRPFVDTHNTFALAMILVDYNGTAKPNIRWCTGHASHPHQLRNTRIAALRLKAAASASFIPQIMRHRSNIFSGGLNA